MSSLTAVNKGILSASLASPLPGRYIQQIFGKDCIKVDHQNDQIGRLLMQPDDSSLS
jgi:hypothetical protein